MYTTPDSFKCNDKDECENAFMWKIPEFSILKFNLFYNMFLSNLIESFLSIKQNPCYYSWKPYITL